ncbi:S41 family peptidase [Candidatus Protochlamydia phocaeensis]|uniref:tail-specific protease Tsp n=1 Tax=Candidatus Protochlamydia phocaeensis TaxID=1414722 RepID=UPI000837EE22|nr:S41 family peptidase [Candidatus Protochlamydia phocaeensis]
MKKWWMTLCLCMLSYVSSLCAHEQDLLKSTDINRIMQQILSQHVDKKAITGDILEHALVTYLEQFDPHKIYLLDSEVEPYRHLPQDQLAKFTEQYKQNDFSIFKQLDQVIKTAILRSRRIRQGIEKQEKDSLFHQPAIKEEDELARNESFAPSEQDLKKRILFNLEIYIDMQKRRYGETPTLQQRDQVLRTYETQLRDFENPYLYQNDSGVPLPVAEQENLFAIHVLKALASSLDSHTSFYQANEAYDMRVRLQKEFQGVGLVLKDLGNEIQVSRLLEGGPAAKSGLIQPGDFLLEVNGKAVADHPFEKVMEMLHNEKNPQVNLVFKRKAANGQPEKIFTVVLKRAEIILNNDRVDVKSVPFGNGIIGEITLHSFYQGDGVSSEKDVRDAIEKLEKKGNLRGLVLDLRDNSGGFLSQAIKVAGLFITNGVIVISKYSSGEERFYRDVDGKKSYDGPLVVLTSKATASAAEIVAQALQDYGVALIVGDAHTYGKGTIQTQTITDNQSTSYFKVTVGKYYTVSGKTPQKQGVKADIVVPGHWNKEEIGEIYSGDDVEADKIPPAYNDDLEDVSPEVKSWYLKYYTPTVQHRSLVWRNLLPTLRKNSEYRIAHNKNYQLFLTGKVPDEATDEEEELLSGTKPKTYGVDDMQMQEAVNIVKDMILLHSIGKK